MAKASKKKSVKFRRAGEPAAVKLYTLNVFLIGHPTRSAKFAKKHPKLYRHIQIRGDQTLEDLHFVIFDAFDRYDEHLYEFQLGKKPMDHDGPRYVLPDDFAMGGGGMKGPLGRVDRATIGSLGLKVGRSFSYWFDFGDDWWHQIDVLAIDDTVPAGKFPKVTKRIGKSPPQYANDEDDDEDEEDEDSDD